MKPNGGGTFGLGDVRRDGRFGVPRLGASDAVPPSSLDCASASPSDSARSPVRGEVEPETADDDVRGHPAWAQGRLDGLTRLLDVFASFMTLEEIARRVKACVAELCQGRVVHVFWGAWQTSLPAEGDVESKAPRVGRSSDNRDLRDRSKAPWLDARFPWPNGIEVPTRLDVSLLGAEASATKSPLPPSTTSLLGLPMRVEGRLLGVVVAEQSSLESSGKGPLRSEERAYYGGLAWVCAQAFERGRLQDEDLRARRRNHWLQRFTAAMSRSAAHADVATVAMTMGLEALEAQDGELWFRREKDAESPWMRVHPANGEGVVMSPVATASAAVEEVLRSREPTVLRQGSALEGGAGFEGDGEAGLLVGVPLSVAGRSLGAWVFRMEGKQLWTETDKAFALAIVHQGALALERARLYEDAQQLALTHQRWAQRSNLLADLGYEIAEATAEFPRLTLTIVQFLARRFQGAGFLRLLDDDGTRFGHVVAWHDDETLREKMRLAASVPSHPTVEESYASVWLNSEKPVWFPRLQEEVRQAWFPQECQPFLREVEPQDLLVAPLRCRGIIRGILGFFRLPGQPMLTEADRSLLEEIAARVAMTLDNARLLRAREEAVQLRDDFLSIAGHELKTPLTSLMLQAAALSKGARGDAERAKLAERADRMAVSGGRLAKLIDELLDVSRLGAGRFTLEREPLDLRIMVAECLDQMRDDIARSKCEVALTQAGEVQGAWDRARMLQVIGNLLSNALKYGPGRPIQVHLHGDPRCVRLSVRDHGIGIAVEDQARIFHRFERAVSPRHFGGLGLGLWIVRLVVEAHGGNIRVESLPQQGSRFEVTLPRTEEAKVHREEMRPWHATGSLEEHGSR